MNKYRNIKTVVDGITFDSKKEAARYGQLKLMEKAGEIAELELQPKFQMVVNGVKLGSYIGDFQYNEYLTPKAKRPKDEHDRVSVVEDVKGVKTPVYNLKKKLVKALYGIEIREI